jgi:hypothetical protein
METIDRVLTVQNVLIGSAIYMTTLIAFHALVMVIDHYTRDTIKF